MLSELKKMIKDSEMPVKKLKHGKIKHLESTKKNQTNLIVKDNLEILKLLS